MALGLYRQPSPFAPAIHFQGTSKKAQALGLLIASFLSAVAMLGATRVGIDAGAGHTIQGYTNVLTVEDAHSHLADAFSQFIDIIDPKQEIGGLQSVKPLIPDLLKNPDVLQRLQTQIRLLQASQTDKELQKNLIAMTDTLIDETAQISPTLKDKPFEIDDLKTEVSVKIIKSIRSGSLMGGTLGALLGVWIQRTLIVSMQPSRKKLNAQA